MLIVRGGGSTIEWMFRVVSKSLPLLLLASCAHSSASRTHGDAPGKDDSYAPEWVLVSVIGARVRDRPSGSWDVEDRGSVNFVQFLGDLIGYANPTFAPVAKVLGAFAPGEGSNDGTLPDPYVSVMFHEAKGNVSRERRSFVAPNSNSPNWNYSFYVRLGDLREAGLDVSVLDEDPEGHAERVGSIHVPRALLEQVATTGTLQNIDTHDDDLDSLHVRIEPVLRQGTGAAGSYELPLVDGVLDTPVRVPEGSLVTVRVRGEGQISAGGMFSCTSSSPQVTPSGLGGAQCQTHNLRYAVLQDAPHGSAFALVGFGTALQAVSLAEAADGSCMQFTVGASGVLALGINDNDAQNNQGHFTFDVEVAPPTARSRCEREPSERIATRGPRGSQDL